MHFGEAWRNRRAFRRLALGTSFLTGMVGLFASHPHGPFSIHGHSLTAAVHWLLDGDVHRPASERRRPEWRFVDCRQRRRPRKAEFFQLPWIELCNQVLKGQWLRYLPWIAHLLGDIP
ncbi:hypothetical protein GGE12_004373 [Rhizobium mongolense]|uniref:Uncharacterized protein n=1 Tax=Rhizobium mongolense TaxID=57676 RepID=A0A7W6WFT5_9HYPH|nr:hypothetical protein [Rhizobium mongolense]